MRPGWEEKWMVRSISWGEADFAEDAYSIHRVVVDHSKSYAIFRHIFLKCHQDTMQICASLFRTKWPYYSMEA